MAGRVQARATQPAYATYKSPYGPKYTVAKNFHGWTAKSATKLGLSLGAFGGVAGFFAVFFLADVPKVRKDILQNFPVIGQLFVKEPLPPSDNVRETFSLLNT